VALTRFALSMAGFWCRTTASRFKTG
jgi:hypothetical protein